MHGNEELAGEEVVGLGYLMLDDLGGEADALRAQGLSEGHEAIARRMVKRGVGDKGTLALNLHEHALVNERLDGALNGSAAHAKGVYQLKLRGNLTVGRPLEAVDLLAHVASRLRAQWNGTCIAVHRRAPLRPPHGTR